jgi:hypothetical protein
MLGVSVERIAKVVFNPFERLLAGKTTAFKIL